MSIHMQVIFPENRLKKIHCTSYTVHLKTKVKLFLQYTFHSAKRAVIVYCDRILACPFLSALPSRSQSRCSSCAKGLYTLDKGYCTRGMEYPCSACCIAPVTAFVVFEKKKECQLAVMDCNWLCVIWIT